MEVTTNKSIYSFGPEDRSIEGQAVGAIVNTRLCLPILKELFLLNDATYKSNEQIAENLKLKINLENADLQLHGKGTEFEYRLKWALNHLKSASLVDKNKDETKSWKINIEGVQFLKEFNLDNLDEIDADDYQNANNQLKSKLTYNTKVDSKKFSSLVVELKQKLKNNNKFRIVENKIGKHFVWIADNQNIIGHEIAHYEIGTRYSNLSTLKVDIHFEGRKKETDKFFSKIGSSLPDKLKWFDWGKSKSIEFEEDYDIDDEDIIEELFEGLNYIDDQIGEKIRKTLNADSLKTLKENDFKSPLNQILYGPPGTGKTYNTINKALEILGEDITNKTRTEIKAIYNEKVNDKQIVFTTFHQSMSYEDFIEGIKPVLYNETDETESKDGALEYEIKDGIFKEICNTAKGISGSINVDVAIDFRNRDFYKMSLGGKHRQDRHNWSIENNLIFLGWGNDKDFTSLNSITDWKTYRDTFTKQFPELVEESKYVIQAVYIFQKMRIGDIVVVSKGNKIIDAIGIIESDYFYDDTKDLELYQFRKVKWLATDLNASPEIFIDKAISQQTIYQFYNQDIKYSAFEEAFNKTSIKKAPKNYVLIIDEINRGNVSQIFGELITLIEEDKRLGKKEALQVTLPYSKQQFGVPSNLHIIGTMNTADRSVEALDTALRRRFIFEEMLPEYDALDKIAFNGFTLGTVLKTINERIEALLDRDHTIGHSNFMTIKSGDTVALQSVFMNKIIPLLQEYFYHDYEKIALVLGEGFVELDEKKTVFAKWSKHINTPELQPQFVLKKEIDAIETAIALLLN